MKLKIYEYKVIYTRPDFEEKSEKYATAPTDEDARLIFRFLLEKAHEDHDVVSIEKYCPYTGGTD